MIYGIGTDLVEIARMQRLIERHGERAAQRLLTAAELVEFASHADPARFLAKRFAAKEAFSKAVGTGVRAPVLLSAVGVGHDELGKPLYQYNETLSTWLAERGIVTVHLSISDEQGHALAFAIATTQ